ncbi:hypothetical protein E3N88_46327 [Mikania micrantha]|uniref:Uncharacterized protein n=1 Tax=Mikania micrantha TaxID=192012 RepID=A0A5N6L6V5_9ASTR|nr:hypothetical protein E3N88_46327 [Mikania micrantha]
MDSSSSRSSFRFFSDQGRVLSEEERAAENVYIKKMEKEKLEKQKLKEAKEKAEKEKAEKGQHCHVCKAFGNDYGDRILSI